MQALAEDEEESYRTVVEAVTILRSPEEFVATDLRPDALSLCLETLFDAVRAYRLVDQARISDDLRTDPPGGALPLEASGSPGVLWPDIRHDAESRERHDPRCPAFWTRRRSNSTGNAWSDSRSASPSRCIASGASRPGSPYRGTANTPKAPFRARLPPRSYSMEFSECCYGRKACRARGSMMPRRCSPAILPGASERSFTHD